MMKLPFQYHSIDKNKLFADCPLNKSLIVYLKDNWDDSYTAAGLALRNYLIANFDTSQRPHWTSIDGMYHKGYHYYCTYKVVKRIKIKHIEKIQMIGNYITH